MSESPPRRPNVVVFLLDSLRYDRTSLGGYERDTTPNTRRIAERHDGQSHETAIAHTRYTLPSTASILTGKYPGDHGAGFGSTNLDERVPTVAESFREAGYNTALVSNNHFVSPQTGLDRGFDRTLVLPHTPVDLFKTVGARSFCKWAANIRSHSAGFETDKYRHSRAFLTTELARQQLDALENEEEPFFLFVHYNQTHRPYYPPLSWFDRYDDAFEMSRSEAGDFVMDVHHNLVEKVANGCPFTDDEWATLGALYDAGIEYTDTFVGELFDEIRSRFGDTVVTVTSDHGEHLGERGALGHKYALDDALLRVPLVTSGLQLPSTTEPVQHSDLMKTLLSLAGADTSFVDGYDLRTDTREFAVSQDDARSLDPIYEINPQFDASQFYPGAQGGLPGRTSLRTATHRYVRGDDGTAALYRLPDETTDIAEESVSIASQLAARTDNWLADHEPVSSNDGTGQPDLADGTKERLMNMGYLEDEL